MTADAPATAAFERVIAAFARDPRVTPPAARRRAFGSNGLKVDGRIFAMLVGGDLVVKLPRARVEALLASRVGVPFDAGGKRVMKEWVRLALAGGSWVELAREARAYVGGGGGKTSAPRDPRPA